MSRIILVHIFTKINSKYLYYDMLKMVIMMSKMYYVKKIRDLREDNDKTQQQIAEYLHTSQTMYARYERGANELPIRHLIALCRYYHVSADYILGIKDEKEKKDD